MHYSLILHCFYPLEQRTVPYIDTTGSSLPVVCTAVSGHPPSPHHRSTQIWPASQQNASLAISGRAAGAGSLFSSGTEASGCEISSTRRPEPVPSWIAAAKHALCRALLCVTSRACQPLQGHICEWQTFSCRWGNNSSSSAWAWLGARTT